MPWKTNSEVEARQRLIAERLALGDGASFTALCRRHGISRECGYKWWRRFRAGGRTALRSQSRVRASAARLQQVWVPRLLQVARRCGDFGPKKLHWQLREDYTRARVPDWRTLARWLAKVGRVRGRSPRVKPGPMIRLPGRLCGRCCNDVWTIDFKGRFRTRDGRWVYALTVRDLASRYLLCVQHLDRPTDQRISRVMRRLFRRYGLPRALRMDNGQPFGAIGPRGWSRLNIEWLKLGIRLEHGRPGCPQDNPAHEQMHGVLKRQTAQPPAATVGAQQRRFAHWRWRYNHRRPHEHLGMQVPAARYRPSPRPLPKTIARWTYPPSWQRFGTDPKGRWRWRGRLRHLGRAFINEQLAARCLGADRLAIYLGPHLLGHLHADDPGTFRLIRRNLPTQRREGLTPLPNPPRSLKDLLPKSVSDV
jgi:putative transposase